MLHQWERQFLFAIRVACVVVWLIFSTSKMKAFCIYFYQGNITFKNMIKLVSFVINLVEYLVINSYSVTVLYNFWKETSDRAKTLEVFNSLTFILGNPPLPPPWSAILDERLMKVSLWQFELPHFFYHISTVKIALQLFRSHMVLSIIPYLTIIFALLVLFATLLVTTITNLYDLTSYSHWKINS